MFVDSHCHIPLIEDDERKPGDIIADAVANDVNHMLCVSVDLETADGISRLAEEFANVFASVGVHPNTERSREEPSVDRLVKLADTRNIVAIGETGVDYFRSEGDLDWQRQRFRVHVRAAREINKPLIIHTRDAASDCLQILREENAQQVGGVMHCFVEDWETASAAMDLGFYVSFSGIVTFKNARDLHSVAQKVPLDRLLIETDSPWLAPVPKRGKQNEPAFVRYIAEFLATLRGESLLEIASATTSNFFDLFSNARRVASTNES